MLRSSAFFPISWALTLIFVILYHYTWKKFLMVVIDISVNHVFHPTAPTIKPYKSVSCFNESIFDWFYFCYSNILVLDLLLILYMAKFGGLKAHNSKDSLKKIAASTVTFERLYCQTSLKVTVTT